MKNDKTQRDPATFVETPPIQAQSDMSTDRVASGASPGNRVGVQIPASAPPSLSPYYDANGITLYHADCREVLPLISSGSLVTDPPYGIDWSRGTWADDSTEYADLMRWLSAEGQRLGGWVFIFQAMPNCHRWAEWFPEGWRIFAACKNFAQIRPIGVYHSWDPVIFWNSGPDNRPNSPKNSGHISRDFHVGNVAGVLSERASHPCPRPLGTMRHLVQLAAPEGGLVVDPFAGSGTTLVAAKATRRRAIGIEIEESYCEVAVERLAQGVLQFTGESEGMNQGGLADLF